MQILWRYGLVTFAIILLASLIVAKAIKNTIIDADKWNQKADKQLSRIDTIAPVRGDILACDGSVLATNLTYYTLCIDFKANAKYSRQFAESLDSLCDSLAVYYPVKAHPTKEAWKEYLSAPLKVDAKDRKSNYLLLRDVSYADYQKVLNFPFFRRYKSKFKHGLTAEARERRAYPYGNMARRSVGRVNEYMPDSNDTKFGKWRKGEIHGYSGLEYALDSLLYGVPGTSKIVPLTHKMSNWVDVPATNGYNVTTTIDINLQDMLEAELNDMLDSIDADWGTAVLMEVKTGDIKAISNLELDTVTGTYIEAMNRALQGYEPGSVMKPISMIVALEDGFAYPLNREFPIGHSTNYRGSTISDTHSPAYLPVSRFIEYSSNIGMTKLIAPHFESDPNLFRERLRKIGFFDPLNTGIAGEHPPVFPQLDIKAGGLVSLSRQIFGYTTQIPPLYTCAMYNAIANNGKFVRPRLVRKLTNSAGIDSVIPVTYVRDSIMSVKNSKVLREMMHDVVYGQGGTAKALKSDIVDIAGKTGTCRIAIEIPSDTIKKYKALGKRPPVGGYSNNLRLAFCGFFPYENPKYTCIVVISNPAPQYRGAATTCGRVLYNVAHKMFARGLLGNTSNYIEDTKSKDGAAPQLVAMSDKRSGSVKSTLGVSSAPRFKTPEKSSGNGSVPDVRGMGMRDAVLTLENAGYNVKFKGNGYVEEQTPSPGTKLAVGSKVTLALTTK